MDQIHVIRHKVLVEGQSQRQVSQQMGLSRNTVRKYLTQSEPKRTGRVARRKPVLERVQARLDELLEAWSGRTTVKQALTGTRLRDQLLAEGHVVGTSLVREYLRAWRRRQEV